MCFKTNYIDKSLVIIASLWYLNENGTFLSLTTCECKLCLNFILETTFFSVLDLSILHTVVKTTLNKWLKMHTEKVSKACTQQTL